MLLSVLLLVPRLVLRLVQVLAKLLLVLLLVQVSAKLLLVLLLGLVLASQFHSRMIHNHHQYLRKLSLLQRQSNHQDNDHCLLPLVP